MELDLDKPAYLGEAQGPSLIPMQASEPIPPRMNGEVSEGPTTAWKVLLQDLPGAEAARVAGCYTSHYHRPAPAPTPAFSCVPMVGRNSVKAACVLITDREQLGDCHEFSPSMRTEA